MKRIATIASLICLLAGQGVAGDNYFIKIERDVLPLSETLQKDRKPGVPPEWKGEPAQTLELRVEPGLPFDVRLVFGQEGIKLRGVLQRVNPKIPDLRIELDYEARFKMTWNWQFRSLRSTTLGLRFPIPVRKIT